MVRSSPINPSAYPVSSQFLTCDANSATSPVSAGSGDAATIAVPAYAAEIIILPDQDVYFSETLACSGYFLIKQNTEHVCGVGNMENVYVKATNTAANVYYVFALIK